MIILLIHRWPDLLVGNACDLVYIDRMSVLPLVLSSQSDIDKALSVIATAEMIAVDTEFLREKTYYPQLCLIQIAGNGIHFALDPLIEGLDLSAFWKILADEAITKVFHAGRQDIEIFYHLTGQVPVTIFDTQIAAMVCGLGDQVGYDKLVQHFLGKVIDKSSRFTDWSKRPLTDKQIQYALDDVIHLETIYPLILSQLETGNKLSWIADEAKILTARQTYEVVPDEIYKKL